MSYKLSLGEKRKARKRWALGSVSVDVGIAEGLEASM
jgi:hypothetical protein